MTHLETGALITRPGATILVLPMAADWAAVARRFEQTLRALGVDQILESDDELAALSRRLAAETASTVYLALLQERRSP